MPNNICTSAGRLSIAIRLRLPLGEHVYLRPRTSCLLSSGKRRLTSSLLRTPGWTLLAPQRQSNAPGDWFVFIRSVLPLRSQCALPSAMVLSSALQTFRRSCVQWRSSPPRAHGLERLNV
ncbi:hypothetical protein K466DRAFT_279085 [Polyporus arcularius HHB13444]|uniref:Uncharacterized protein n=1 Tax=Polyporus arcularius HHB13444 TaxID=1314778 RepID=A0A5C3PR52_9APHY|nr:hypothetical protein K466DRAFT_279085 [Polyporus arcularius HHB13444]